MLNNNYFLNGKQKTKSSNDNFCDKSDKKKKLVVK